MVSAVRCLLFDLWYVSYPLQTEIEAIVAGSWAGEVLQSMNAHDATQVARRQAKEEYASPENVQKRREEKKRLKQERHQQGLAVKQERTVHPHVRGEHP